VTREGPFWEVLEGRTASPPAAAGASAGHLVTRCITRSRYWASTPGRRARARPPARPARRHGRRFWLIRAGLLPVGRDLREQVHQIAPLGFAERR